MRIHVHQHMSSVIGSSPRVWGRFRRKVDGRYHVIRFIPTRVGQMLRMVLLPPLKRKVHPHACGADWHYFGRGKWWLSGSSPRVWGRSMYRMRPPSCCRGSSPRVWGRCCVEEPPTEHAFRFIPTRVGQMGSECFGGGHYISVHPHACGADSVGASMMRS